MKQTWLLLQVHKLLQKHKLLCAEQRDVRPPLDRDALAALYEQHKGAADWLESMAEAMPVPVTNKQLMKWLKKYGIVERTKRKRKPGVCAAIICTQQY